MGLQVGNRPQQIVESVFIASESGRPVVKPNYSPRLHAIPPVQANQV